MFHLKDILILLEFGNQSLIKKDYLTAKDYYNKILIDNDSKF